VTLDKITAVHIDTMKVHEYDVFGMRPHMMDTSNDRFEEVSWTPPLLMRSAIFLWEVGGRSRVGAGGDYGRSLFEHES
jgi:hypothetical protein